MSAPAAPCRGCHGPLEEGDLRCAVCGLACPTHEAGPRKLAHILRCSECGAAVAYSAEAQAPKCQFCRAVMRLEEPVDPVEQAEWIVPFAVSPDDAHAALRRWMSTLGFFRPRDLATSATVDGSSPLFWAAWIVNADAYVSWTADSDAGSWRSQWAPHAGQTLLPFRNLLISASRGLTLAETARLAPHVDLRHALDARSPAASPERLAGTRESFDVQRSAARRTVSEAITATAAEVLQRGTIPGSRFRKVQVAAMLHRLETRRVALPSYVLAYRYRKRLYRAVVHGQDVRCVFGRAPLSVAKVALVVALVLAVVAGAIVALLVGR